MGNLADELADAFSDSGEEDVEDEHSVPGDTDDSDIEINNAKLTARNETDDRVAGTKSTLPLRDHRRVESTTYDGSEYGSEPDFDVPGVSLGLVAKIDAIESLVRRGTENYGGSADDVVNRVTEALRDLGSQSSVEASASR